MALPPSCVVADVDLCVHTGDAIERCLSLPCLLASTSACIYAQFLSVSLCVCDIQEMLGMSQEEAERVEIEVLQTPGAFAI